MSFTIDTFLISAASNIITSQAISSSRNISSDRVNYIFNKSIKHLTHQGLCRYLKITKENSYIHALSEDIEPLGYIRLSQYIENFNYKPKDCILKEIIYQLYDILLYLERNFIYNFSLSVDDIYIFQSNQSVKILLKNYFLYKIFHYTDVMIDNDCKYYGIICIYILTIYITKTYFIINTFLLLSIYTLNRY